MIIASASQFHIYLLWVNAFSINIVLNVKALVGAFNQEKAQAGAFSVIVQTDGTFAAPATAPGI